MQQAFSSRPSVVSAQSPALLCRQRMKLLLTVRLPLLRQGHACSRLDVING
jgi:hypothetical protein